MLAAADPAEALPPAWAAPYVGAPYAPLGDDPQGWDCWGLVTWVFAHVLGRPAPAFPPPDVRRIATDDPAARRAVVEAGLARWAPVEGPRPRRPAAVLMVRGRSVLRHHCGVTDGRGMILHATRAAGTVYVPLTDVAPYRIEGFYEPR